MMRIRFMQSLLSGSSKSTWAGDARKGPRGERSGSGTAALPFFEVLQAGVEDFFDAVQLGRQTSFISSKRRSISLNRPSI